MFSIVFRLSRQVALISACLFALHTPPWRHLADQSPFGMARAYAVDVQRGVEVEWTGYFRITNSRTCTEDFGSWTVNTPPTNGTIRFAAVPLIIQDFNGNPCTIYANVPFYTFTNPTATSDTWAATWTDSLGNVRDSGFAATIAAPFKQAKCKCPSCPCDGDPVSLAMGALTERVSDYATAGPNRLTFERYYNYYPNLVDLGTASVPSTFTGALGLNWKSNYDRFLRGVYNAGGQLAVIVAERLDGSLLSFAWNGSQWVTDSDVEAQLTQSGTTFSLVGSDDTTETYGSFNGGNQALLTSIRSRNGYTQFLTYNANNQLSEVTDSYGRNLILSYQNGLLATVVTPDGLKLTYNYTASGLSGSNVLDLLGSVTYSTSPATSLAYLYENTSLPTELTGIVDENGGRFGTWSYDADGRALSSQHAGGADLTSFSYSIFGFTTATNALSQPTKSWFTGVVGAPKVYEIDRLATASTAAASRVLNYDDNGYVSGETDWNGNTTNYVNEARGLPTTITEAAGTPQQRVTMIAWDATFRLPDQIVAPGLTTAFTYDPSGNRTSKTETDTTGGPTNGQTRSWTYTWANFLPTSITDPRGYTTSFGWDASGALVSITNPLGQKTQITAHLPGGLPTIVIDPNGVETDLAYDARNRLVSSTVHTSHGLLTTSYAYDPAGNLIKTTLPDGSALTDTYDAAHRLVGVTDLLGNQIAYTLDALGDRTQTNYASGAAVTRMQQASFDALGRMLQDIGGAGQTTAYSYDNNGNITGAADPLGRQTAHAFDALNRLARVTDPSGGVTVTAFDPQDHPVQVTDPNGHATTYAYDGFGDVIAQTSPDSGTTGFSYDAAGNRVQRVDAAGAVTNWTYDALNRPASRTYPSDPAENVSYFYDEASGGFGVGRLTQVTDIGGTLAFSYDERGNRLAQTRTRGPATLATFYAYDAADRVNAITYPSGAVVDYARDTMGRVTGVSVTPAGAAGPLTVLSGIAYEPFGPPTTLTYGNGVGESRSYDLDYRMTSLVDTGKSVSRTLGYGYDADDNVLSLGDTIPGGSQSFGYDELDHLAAASDAGYYGNIQGSYDAVGNLTAATVGSANIGFAYFPGGNRLQSLVAGGTTIRQFTYTPTGNIATDQQGSKLLTLGYNQDNRLASASIQVNGGAQSNYQYYYDAFGQRLAKSLLGTPGNITVYSYDQSARLLEEDGYTSAGVSPQVDYIYLGDRPVAMLLGGNLLFLHADRLGTIEAATDANQNVGWAALYQPLGGIKPLINDIAQNLRFPGQYADAEIGYYHNGARDYDPTIGRYIESDPIGLAGGLNPYVYGMANPVNRYDTEGLSPNGAPITPADYHRLYQRNQEDQKELQQEITQEFGAFLLTFIPAGKLAEIAELIKSIKHACDVPKVLILVKKYQLLQQLQIKITVDWEREFPRDYKKYFSGAGLANTDRRP